jgi:hypothetical protein
VFWIGGVPKVEQNSDSTQALIAYHLKEKHDVGSVFFKTHRNEFYVDSAVCKRCDSTVIEFDIELSDEVLVEVSRLTGRPIEELRSEIETLAERITGDDRNAEQVPEDWGQVPEDWGQALQYNILFFRRLSAGLTFRWSGTPQKARRPSP